MSYAQRDRDREVLDRLLEVGIPSVHDTVVLGALLFRYHYPDELRILSQDIMEGWGIAEHDLLSECRRIWAGGYRPTNADLAIGSANDTTEES
tara:strand:+ start:2099 stop:2377 length:279 start_codon:yes stop_codon:yes gene_type:complete